MPVFHYTAKDNNGKTRYGEIDSASDQVAADVLRSRGLVVVELTEEGKEVLKRDIQPIERITLKDIAIFSRQLSTMVGASMPLMRSLEALAQNTTKVKMRKIIEKLAKDVDGGVRFSIALASYPKVFDDFYVSVIKSGEVSGEMDSSLIYLAEQLEKDYDLLSKLRGAMIYPLFVIGMFLAVGALMVISVIPQLKKVFEGMDQELPAVTQWLLSTSDFLRGYWWLILVLILFVFLAYKWYNNTNEGHKNIDKIKIKLPIFGKILQKVYAVRFSRSFYTLLVGGISVVEAIKVSGSVVGNVVYKEIAEEAAKRVESGDTVASAFELHSEIPTMMTQMIRVGEKTGKLSDVLEKVGDFYNREVNNEISNLTVTIEPLIMIILGIGVFILMAAIIIPIYNIANSF